MGCQRLSIGVLLRTLHEQGLPHAQGLDGQDRRGVGAACRAAWATAGEHAGLVDELVEVGVEQGVGAVETDAERIDRADALLYGRAPAKEELSLGLAFLSQVAKA